MKMNPFLECAVKIWLGGCLLVGMNGAALAGAGVSGLTVQDAERSPAASADMILGAARAGTRIVAVGARGVVLLSDDAGQSWRQARSVAVDSTLTGVAFVDARLGWAVGQWGVVLRTSDGGETWTRQRLEMSVDQPLFSVYFKDDREGWAVGLWSLMLHTVDAGEHWSMVDLPRPPGAKKADRNLYAIFADAHGTLFVACEQGRVMRSTDGGAHWTYVETGYAGSFWSGIALRDGSILVGGLRGSVYRSTNGGDTWAAVATPFKSSITGIVQLGDRSVLAVALDGVSFTSHDDGLTFTGQQRSDRETLTAVAESPRGGAVLFSADGPVRR